MTEQLTAEEQFETFRHVSSTNECACTVCVEGRKLLDAFDSQARRIAELEQENANWKQMYESDEACIATFRATAEPRASLQDAWNKYGRHLSSCQRYGRLQCTCGFAETSQELEVKAAPTKEGGK